MPMLLLSVCIENMQSAKATIRNHVMLMFKLEIAISCAGTKMPGDVSRFAWICCSHTYAYGEQKSRAEKEEEEEGDGGEKSVLFTRHTCFVSNSSSNSVFFFFATSAGNCAF